MWFLMVPTWFLIVPDGPHMVHDGSYRVPDGPHVVPDDPSVTGLELRGGILSASWMHELAASSRQYKIGERRLARHSEVKN